VRIRDVIRLGETQDLLIKVTEATKAVEAKLITCREEMAASRSQAAAGIIHTHATSMLSSAFRGAAWRRCLLTAGEHSPMLGEQQMAGNYKMGVNLNVRDLMRIPVHSVHPRMPLIELDQEFLDKRVSGFPVVENAQLVGVVSRSDVVRKLAFAQHLVETTSDFYRDSEGFHESPTESLQEIAHRVGQQIESLCVRDLMSPHLVVVTVDDSIEVAAQKLWESRIHRLPVVDQGRLAGILSTLDLVRLFADKRVKILR